MNENRSPTRHIIIKFQNSGTNKNSKSFQEEKKYTGQKLDCLSTFQHWMDTKRQRRENIKILRENEFQIRKSVLSHDINQMSVKHKDIFRQARSKLLLEVPRQNE